jgi:Spy/CpxP family protein refolding chaperone
MLRAWTVIGTFAVASACFAGPFKNGEKAGHFGGFKRAVQELNLTDQQKIQMREIVKSAKAKAREDMSSVLTDEQKQQVEKLKAEIKAKKKQAKQ